MTLRLTRATDYAILAMMHLGSLPDGRIVLRDEIARAYDIPPSFLAKVLRQLVQAGLLRSTRGAYGGFGIQRRASEINLLDILEAIEGRIPLTDGARGRPTSGVWPEVQRQMASLLRGTTLEALLSARRVNSRVDYRIGA